MMNSYFWIHILNIKIIGPRKGHPFPLLLAILLPWQPRAPAVAFSTMEGFTLLARPESSGKGLGDCLCLLEAGKCGAATKCGAASFMHPAVSYLYVLGCARLWPLCKNRIPRSLSAICLTSAQSNISSSALSPSGDPASQTQGLKSKMCAAALTLFWLLCTPHH